MTTTIHGLNGATARMYAGDAPVPEDHVDLVVEGAGHVAGIVMPAAEVAKMATHLCDALREQTDGVVAHVLTPEQQDVVRHFRALNVPASWFVGEPDGDGNVEVLAMGNADDGTCVGSGALVMDAMPAATTTCVRCGESVVVTDDGHTPTHQTDTEGFLWSFRIEPNGEFSNSEASIGEFETGINC